MQFSAQRNDLLSALQKVIGVVERKQTMPILSCVLVQVLEDHLVITATDLELELVTRCEAEVGTQGSLAIPARKLFDICRGLPEDSEITADIQGEQVRIRSGKARFMLSCISGDNWPGIEDFEPDAQLEVPEQKLKQLLEKTEFAMAHQDYRSYLNGLLIALRPDLIRCVATDGHRLALSESSVELPLEQSLQAIVPRKAIIELSKLLAGDSEQDVAVKLSRNHLRIEVPAMIFTTKLIDGRFPDYERVIPQDNDKRLTANREKIRQALTRTAILSNENFGGVRLSLDKSQLKIQAQNVDKEEAEDELAVEYQDEPLEIGFNVRYLLDALAVMETEEFTLDLANENSSGLLQEKEGSGSRYVVMPMRL